MMKLLQQKTNWSINYGYIMGEFIDTENMKMFSVLNKCCQFDNLMKFISDDNNKLFTFISFNLLVAKSTLVL